MIFISHRQIDRDKAKGIHDHLEKKRIRSYLDILDPNVRGPEDITNHIIEQLRKCSHVIAVFTINTQGSLWVPFELGAAYEGNKGIGTYVWESPTIPEYLNAFPIMRSKQDLDVFLEEYSEDYRQKGENILEARMRYSTRGTKLFAERLKIRLRQ